jgi:hypothetical protein
MVVPYGRIFFGNAIISCVFMLTAWKEIFCCGRRKLFGADWGRPWQIAGRAMQASGKLPWWLW